MAVSVLEFIVYFRSDTFEEEKNVFDQTQNKVECRNNSQGTKVRIKNVATTMATFHSRKIIIKYLYWKAAND